MNLEPSTLLSEDFAEFSGKVTALHEKKKELTEEFKKLFENHKEEMAALDAEAVKLQNDFLERKDAREDCNSDAS